MQREKFQRIGRKTFAIISFFPLGWLCLLYLFTLSAWIKLGHFPVPSLNDPKYLGLEPFYIITILGLFVTIYSVFLWLILLPLSIYFKLLTKKHVIIMLIGIVVLFLQLNRDPFLIVYWLLD